MAFICRHARHGGTAPSPILAMRPEHLEPFSAKIIEEILEGKHAQRSAA
jgi:hypothetical protein